MSSRFAAAVCCGLLRIERELGVSGPVAEIGPFSGVSLLLWRMPWPPRSRWASISSTGRTRRLPTASRPIAPSTAFRPSAVSPGRPIVARCGPKSCWRNSVHPGALFPYRAAFPRRTVQGPRARDGRAGPRWRHRARRSAAPGLSDPDGGRARVSRRHPEMCVLGIIDRETIVAATKFVLCQADCSSATKRPARSLSGQCLAARRRLEPHWCLVFSLDTRLASIV